MLLVRGEGVIFSRNWCRICMNMFWMPSGGREVRGLSGCWRSPLAVFYTKRSVGRSTRISYTECRLGFGVCSGEQTPQGGAVNIVTVSSLIILSLGVDSVLEVQWIALWV